MVNPLDIDRNNKNNKTKPKKWIRFIKSFTPLTKDLYLSLNFVYNITLKCIRSDDYEISDEYELKEYIEYEFSSFPKLKIKDEILLKSCSLLWSLYNNNELK